MTTRQVGRLCERAVCADLQKRGAQVLATNYTCREGELDIIAREDEYIVFVEVKARQSSSFGTPAQAVTRAKQKKLILAAQKYLMETGIEAAVRFDVAQVFYRPDGDTITAVCVDYIEGAFEEVL